MIRSASPAYVQRAKERLFLDVTRQRTSECWLWNKGTNAKGYGRLAFGGKVVFAHRLSWEIANGMDVPSGLLVCHRCDVPRCINPDHLFVGDNTDNMRDCVAKGRHPRASQDHCIWGHSLTDPANVRTYGGSRHCNACHRERQRERSRRQSSEARA